MTRGAFGWAIGFEVIAGKAVPADGRPRCFGYVQTSTRVAGYCILGWYRSDGIRLERAGRPRGVTAAAGGVGYFSCSRAAVRKMAPSRWVNSAWVVTSVVNQSSWLPAASFFSASTTDSSAAW